MKSRLEEFKRLIEEEEEEEENPIERKLDEIDRNLEILNKILDE